MKKCRCLSFIIVALSLLLVTGSCKSSRTASRSAHYKKESGYIGGLSYNPATLKGEERRIVEEALTWLGTPYRYGGQDYSGTDCSGLTMKVYIKALGLTIPRSSAAQQKFCKSIKKSSMGVGDLLFFATGRDKNRVSHVGLYLGHGQFIHASASRGVIISNIEEKYYTSHYHSSGHVSRPGEKKAKGKDKSRKRSPQSGTTAPQPKPQQQKVETEPLQFELDEAIESKIDSIYSSFLE